ncbi:MAG: GNAT family N-acetyltransferase, partial [Myxococcota bacterium]
MPDGPRRGPLYKILPQRDWDDAGAVVPWAEIDRADGFVHLSAAHQVRETAAKHFAGRPNLCILEVDPGRLEAGTLRWEVSRGNDRFPHVHGDIGREAVVGAEPLPERDGRHTFSMHVPEPVVDTPLPEVLALRLERAEAGALLALAHAARRLAADPPLLHTVGSAVAAGFGPQSPINGVKGWGLDGVPSGEALEALTGVFGAAEFAVEVCSHAHPDTLALLAAHGYAATATENVLWRRVSDEGSSPSAVTLEATKPGEGEAWGEMLVRGFTDGAPVPDDLARIGPLTPAQARTDTFFIVADDVRVGVCGLRYDHEVAMMVGSSVLREYRGRGHHRAAIELRLARAHQAGCRVAKFDVQPGSASHRNAHRCGFSLSHTRTAFVKR